MVSQDAKVNEADGNGKNETYWGISVSNHQMGIRLDRKPLRGLKKSQMIIIPSRDAEEVIEMMISELNETYHRELVLGTESELDESEGTGYERGHDNGYEEGHEDGYEKGLHDAPDDHVLLTEDELQRGKRTARKKGYEAGYDDGSREISEEEREYIEYQAKKEVLLEKALCRRCRQADAESLHHIVPRRYGGGDLMENLIPLCDECHDEVEELTYNLFEQDCRFEVNTLKEFIEGDFPNAANSLE